MLSGRPSRITLAIFVAGAGHAERAAIASDRGRFRRPARRGRGRMRSSAGTRRRPLQKGSVCASFHLVAPRRTPDSGVVKKCSSAVNSPSFTSGKPGMRSLPGVDHVGDLVVGHAVLDPQQGREMRAGCLRADRHDRWRSASRTTPRRGLAELSRKKHLRTGRRVPASQDAEAGVGRRLPRRRREARS